MSAPAATVYLTEWCPYCQRARGLLDRKGVTVNEINVEDDAKFRQEMQAKSGGSRTVPQIFIGDKHIGGCDDLFELERRGELDKLLQGTS